MVYGGGVMWILIILFIVWISIIACTSSNLKPNENDNTSSNENIKRSYGTIVSGHYRRTKKGKITYVRTHRRRR